MTAVVEDGTIVDGANSYASMEAAYSYAADRGLDFSPSPDLDGEQALIRATAAIDYRYGGRFGGIRVAGREQSLQWPRSGAYDVSGWLIPDDEIPTEIVVATIEAAIRERANPGSMMPDLERGGAINSISAGSVSITYAANAATRTTFTLIESILSGILTGTGGSAGGLFGSVVRG